MIVRSFLVKPPFIVDFQLLSLDTEGQKVMGIFLIHPWQSNNGPFEDDLPIISMVFVALAIFDTLRLYILDNIQM